MIFITEKHSEKETIYAIGEYKFEETLLKDTYDKYGQEVGAYDAASYSLHNSNSSAAEQCLDELVEKFGTEYANGVIKEGQYQHNEIVDVEDIQKFVDKWEEENANHEKVKAYTYWNGSNFVSIIIEAEYQDNVITHEVIEDESESLAYAIKNKQFFKNQNGINHSQSDCGEYLISETQYAGMFASYEILPIDSWQARLIKGEVEEY